MKKKNLILIHILFWIITVFTTFLTNIPELDNIPISQMIKGYSVYFIFPFILFYVFYFFITEDYLNKKKLALLIVFGTLFTIVILIPLTLLYIYISFKQVYTLEGLRFIKAVGSYYFGMLETYSIFIICGSLLKITLLWYNKTIKQKEIEKQIIANELTLLRAQINPHFLFNTLNNIKALINSIPSKAIYSVEKLSEIMSYMLYESSEEKVFLSQEIDYINNYIDLQNVRYENSGMVDFKVRGEYSNISIPPLIFTPFIENAFKYGDLFSAKPSITILIEIRNSNLYFEVNNLIGNTFLKSDVNGSYSKSLIKRRLDLLFKDEYNLETTEINNEYNIRLLIPVQN